MASYEITLREEFEALTKDLERPKANADNPGNILTLYLARAIISDAGNLSEQDQIDFVRVYQYAYGTEALVAAMLQLADDPHLTHSELESVQTIIRLVKT